MADDDLVDGFNMLMGHINEIIHEGGGCQKKKFVLAVWCECQNDGPVICGSTEYDAKKLVHMLQMAAERIPEDGRIHEPAAGHA